MRRHTPGAGGFRRNDDELAMGVTRPSVARMPMTSSAASRPTDWPSVFACPSAMAESELAHSGSSNVACVGK